MCRWVAWRFPLSCRTVMPIKARAGRIRLPERAAIPVGRVHLPRVRMP